MSDTLLADTGASADVSPSEEGSISSSGESQSSGGDFSFFSDDGLRPEIANLITDDNKAAKSFFEKYKGAEDANKAIIDGIANMQYMMGQKAMTRPDENAPEHVKEAFLNHLRNINNVPEKPDGYGIERPEDIPEEMWNAEEISQYADIFHKHNISPDAVKDLMERYTEGLRSVPEQLEAQQAQSLKVERDKLNSEFGMEAEKMIKRASEAANLWGLSQEEAARIGQTAEGIKLLARLKNSVSSDVTSNTQSSGMNQNRSSYEEQAIEAAKAASEAYAKGDMASYRKFSEQQTHYNQLHAQSLKS